MKHCSSAAWVSEADINRGFARVLSQYFLQFLKHFQIEACGKKINRNNLREPFFYILNRNNFFGKYFGSVIPQIDFPSDKNSRVFTKQCNRGSKHFRKNNNFASSI